MSFLRQQGTGIQISSPQKNKGNLVEHSRLLVMEPHHRSTKCAGDRWRDRGPVPMEAGTLRQPGPNAAGLSKVQVGHSQARLWPSPSQARPAYEFMNYMCDQSMDMLLYIMINWLMHLFIDPYFCQELPIKSRSRALRDYAKKWKTIRSNENPANHKATSYAPSELEMRRESKFSK